MGNWKASVWWELNSLEIKARINFEFWSYFFIRKVLDYLKFKQLQQLLSDELTMVLFCTSSSEIIIARGISNTVSPTSKSSLAMVPRPAPSTSIWRIKHANYNRLVLWNFGAPPMSPTYNYTTIRNQIKHQ